MNRFYVITNRVKDKDLVTTTKIKQYLLEHGAVCGVHIYDWNPKCETIHYTDAAEIPEGTQVILVLGGDGSLIQTASDVAGRGIPLLGINLGTMGFLAGADRNELYPVLDRLLADEYEVEERMMLCGKCYQNGAFLHHEQALNDIVITRTGALHIIRLNIYVNDELLTVYHADGIIISTPTGSTGYNLSAGGPIMAPNADMMVMTPVCAHTPNARSIILSATDRIKIEIGPGRREENEITAVTFDGSRGLSLSSGEFIEVCKSVQTTRMIKLNKDSFLEVLRKKMAETEWK